MPRACQALLELQPVCSWLCTLLGSCTPLGSAGAKTGTVGLLQAATELCFSSPSSALGSFSVPLPWLLERGSQQSQDVLAEPGSSLAV